MQLQDYNVGLLFVSPTITDADLMIRLPLPQLWSPESPNVNCYFLEHEDISNVIIEMIKKKTAVDPLLSRVYRYTLSEWPTVVDPELVPFKNKKDELTLEQGCLLWGTRVVIPTSLQKEVLKELHETHPQITKMKALARSYVWWPKIDVDIERTVSLSKVCQSMRSNPPGAPVHPWTFPSAHPWSRLHVDFAGTVAGRMYLVLVDAYG